MACKPETSALRFLQKRRVKCPEPMHGTGVVLNGLAYAKRGQCKRARRLAMSLFKRCKVRHGR